MNGRKVLKILGLIIGTPVVLVLLLAVLLYLPPVQNWAVRQVAAYASRTTGMDISVGHVKLLFPLDLGVEKILVLQRPDTLANIESARVDVKLLPLLHSEVVINNIGFTNLQVNTKNLISNTQIIGRLRSLSVNEASKVNWKESLADVTALNLADGFINVWLSDTAKEDTTPSTNKWIVKARQLNAKNTKFQLHMPGDTMSIALDMPRLTAQDVGLDLGKSAYSIAGLNWQEGALAYDNNFEFHARSGIDFNHLKMTKLALAAKDFSYADGTIDVDVQNLSFAEQSGLLVKKFAGPFYMDSTSLKLDDIDLTTSVSKVRGKVEMDLNAFADKDPGQLKADVHASLGKPDVMLFMADAPKMLRKNWPYYPLNVDGRVAGNLQKLHLNKVRVNMPMVVDLTANGTVANIMDTDHLIADLDVKGRTMNTGFVNTMMRSQLGPDIRIPNNIGLTAKVKARGPVYDCNFIASQGGGRVKGKAFINTRTMAYNATVDAGSFPLRNFLPHMPLHPLTGTIAVTGHGTDIFSPSTKLKVNANISRFRYDNYDLNNIVARANIANGKAHLWADCNNDLLKGNIGVDALTSRRWLRATVTCDLEKADLHGLGLTDENVTAALCGHIDVSTDMKENHRAWGMLSDMAINDNGKLYRPEDMVLNVLAQRDTTNAVIDCGDFHLNASLSEGYKKIMSHSSSLMTELQRQWKARVIDEKALRAMVPTGHIYLKSGSDNIFAGLMRKYDVVMKTADVDLTMSPAEGINGKVSVDSLLTQGIQLDTIRLNFNSTDDGMAYKGTVINGPQNPQYTFRAEFDGGLKGQEAALNAKLYDEHDRLGVGLGLTAQMYDYGIRAHLNDDPVLGYKKFKVNDDNYLILANNRRVAADLDLLADDGTGVKVYTDNENTEALQDLTVSLNKFDLEKVLSVIPYTPNVTGMLDGDFHLIQTEDNITVSSSLAVNKLTYENCPMGDVSADLVYMPMGDGGHKVSGLIYSEGNEVATLDGQLAKDGQINADLQLEKFPLQMANGFVPDQLLGLRGYGEGTLTIKGTTSKPDVTGEVYLDSASLFSQPYGVEMRFANDPVRIENSKLLFENFEMFANNDQPLNISGTFDFSDLDRMMLNVRMRAQNFEVIDAKENPRSEAYGKAFVNFFGVMSGPLDALKLRGKVDVLGNTDMVYVMRDSELSTDNQLDELVKFTNLEDTVTEVVNRPPLTGMDMSLMLSVDESAHILCMLNADHSNYIDLMGGGDLRMNYNEADGLQLTGRYTLNNGEMKYALPVIPLKTFTIQNGSYIEFTGDPMDPTLNITATEAVKATVNEGTGVGRVVDFTCGVKLSKTLSSPGIEFIIDAPNDMSIQDELNTMSDEGRGKVAVTMLASGMYLTDGNTSSFSMNSALSSFLQGEINNIAGKAMRSMGLDIGMSIDNATTNDGSLHTDYNFKFSKRLWNNRLSVIVGGKVSTGAEVEGDRNNNFFDNVELQYRLDQNSSKYLRLFYNNSYYDWLEGNVGLYGAGFMWKRKLRHFKDIFRFNNETPIMAPRDSTANRGDQPKQ